MLTINETNLGTDSTRQDAEKVISILNNQGYDVAYGYGNWEFDNDDDRAEFENAIAAATEEL